jgi:hypothetical protein
VPRNDARGFGHGPGKVIHGSPGSAVRRPSSSGHTLSGSQNGHERRQSCRQRGDTWQRPLPRIRGGSRASTCRRATPPRAEEPRRSQVTEAVIALASLGSVALMLIWTRGFWDVWTGDQASRMTSPFWAAVFAGCYAPLNLWGPALLMLTWAYHRRTAVQTDRADVSRGCSPRAPSEGGCLRHSRSTRHHHVKRAR